MKDNIYPLLWRELRRQKKSKFTLVLQVLIYGFLFSYFCNYITLEIILLLIPFTYIIIIQADVFNYDFTNCIESLLSLPINIINVIKSKCIFILLKTYVLSIVTVIILFIYHTVTKEVNLKFSIEFNNIFLLLGLPIWQYYYSVFIGLLLWNAKKKNKIVPYILQTIILSTCILLISKNMTNILLLILLVMLISIIISIKNLSGSLNKESILKRSI